MLYRVDCSQPDLNNPQIAQLWHMMRQKGITMVGQIRPYTVSGEPQVVFTVLNVGSAVLMFAEISLGIEVTYDEEKIAREYPDAAQAWATWMRVRLPSVQFVKYESWVEFVETYVPKP